MAGPDQDNDALSLKTLFAKYAERANQRRFELLERLVGLITTRDPPLVHHLMHDNLVWSALRRKHVPTPKGVEMVDQTGTSWNQVVKWLTQIEALRSAA